MSVTIFIDTSDQDTAKVALQIGRKRYEKSSQSRVMKAQMVLPLIEALLGDQAKKLVDIKEIHVVTGPGSYTGLRVGVAVANALATFLGVAVNGRRRIEELQY
ncbi:hypothetical protein HY948_04500 [Candidatus Gottesmanbacteria bacterium]|nr:hypothetical protein [Candidatus Gottesmanbacteria bacterium]